MEPTEKNTKQWYALYVNVRHERIIGQKLAEKGMESYVPLVKKMSQWSDRKKLVETPLISGYVFVCLDAGELDKPRYVAGVVNYVRFQGKPAVIRSAEIEALKYFIDHGFALEETNEELKVGDQVGFHLSDFKAFVAVVENFVGDQYAVVTFEGVAKNYRLKVALKALKKKTQAS